MLDQTQAETAAGLILEHWQTGSQMDALPDALRPAARGEGYAIQAQLEAASRSALFGWKIAATSEGGQQHIGVDGPLAGRLLAERLIAAEHAPSLNGNHMKVAEPEFAFRMAQSLPPRSAVYGREEVLAAVGDLHLAIELPSSRFLDFASVGAPQLIADNACAHQFLLGPRVEDGWRGLDLSRHPVTATVAGKLTEEGSGGAVHGDPRDALAWLVNEVSGLGLTLESGQVVTTGTCTTPLAIAPGDRVLADFGALGRVELQLAD